MSQNTSNAAAQYPAALVAELDELTYKRFRKETNQSQGYTEEDARRIHQLVSQLWRVPKAGPGDIVAGAQLEAIIGKGAFGTVWKATELASGALRAVKIFDADRLGDGMAVHLFRRGVRAMQYLRQQNEEERSQGGETQELSRLIVPICQVESHMLAFSMEWLPGGDLSKGYVRGRTLDEKLRLFRHIARAIRYAHTRPSRIVHRDIKPQNIVMSGDLPILTDFDIADMAFAKTLSRRAVGGAFAYAAPEQLSGECEHLELRSDIYSLGRLLHFFLLEDDPPLLIERIPPLDDLNDYPEGLVKIIRRCTHRDPPMRYANVQELLDELDQYEQAEQVGAYGPNLVLAQRHWEWAEDHAAKKAWEAALVEARQAQAYLKGTDSQRSQSWSFQERFWRFRAGSWLLGPGLIYLWFQRLSWPVAFGLLLLMLSPLAFPASRYIQRQAKGVTFEAALQQLLKARSLTSSKSLETLAYFSNHPERLAFVRKRLLLLLSQAHKTRGFRSCRYLELMYALAPRSQSDLLGEKVQEKGRSCRQFYLFQLFPKEFSHVRAIRCPAGVSFRGSAFSPLATESFTLWLKGLVLRGPGVDLRAIHASKFVLDNSQLPGADLRLSSLFHLSCIRCQIKGARFDFADLRKARLSHAQFQRSSFRHADLRGADLRLSRLNFADMRRARLDGVHLQYGTWTGALFSADAVPALNRGGMYDKSLQGALCLSGGFYLMGGLAGRCYDWHRRRSVHKGKARAPRPPHCPERLSPYAPIISYPPGQLQREGVCPWQVTSLRAISRDLPLLVKAATMAPAPSLRRGSLPSSKPTKPTSRPAAGQQVSTQPTSRPHK